MTGFKDFALKRLDIRGCVDSGDGISLNRDRAIFQDAALSVHGDHGTVRHDQIHPLLGEGRRRIDGGRQAADQEPTKALPGHKGDRRELRQVHPQRLTGAPLRVTIL